MEVCQLFGTRVDLWDGILEDFNVQKVCAQSKAKLIDKSLQNVSKVLPCFLISRKLLYGSVYVFDSVLELDDQLVLDGEELLLVLTVEVEVVVDYLGSY